MYTNISVYENKIILNNVLELNMTGDKTEHKLLDWYDVITKQSYFSHKVNLVIQNEGLVMGVPSSALLLEVLLQFIG
jgi:hypothetical protein